MSQELRKVFETFLKDFKESYNNKILLVLDDLRFHASRLCYKKTSHYRGYKEALKDVEKVVKKFK